MPTCMLTGALNWTRARQEQGEMRLTLPLHRSWVLHLLHHDMPASARLTSGRSARSTASRAGRMQLMCHEPPNDPERPSQAVLFVLLRIEQHRLALKGLFFPILQSFSTISTRPQATIYRAHTLIQTTVLKDRGPRKLNESGLRYPTLERHGRFEAVINSALA
jgi:hypothetical protein